MIIDILDAYGNLRCSKCAINALRYANGNIALEATCTAESKSGIDPESKAEEGDLWGMLTVNTEEVLPEGYVMVKDYSEGTGNLRTLREADLVEEPERYVSSGWVQIPVCKLTEKGRKAFLREEDK